MEMLLVAASILGGITALWFLAEKLWPGFARLIEAFKRRGLNQRDLELLSYSERRMAEDWGRIRFGDHYIAWRGPLEFIRREEDQAWSRDHVGALSSLKASHPDLELKYAMPFRVSEYKERGFEQLFETDCRWWRRELIDRDQFIMMLRLGERQPWWSPSYMIAVARQIARRFGSRPDPRRSR